LNFANAIRAALGMGSNTVTSVRSENTYADSLNGPAADDHGRAPAAPVPSIALPN